MSRIILLIQSDPAGAERVQEALSDSSNGTFQVEWRQRCSEGLEYLAAERGNPQSRVEAILLDLFLEDSSGIETFDRLFVAAPHLPILVLCKEGDEEVPRRAVQGGAQDFLLTSRMDGYVLTKILGSMLKRAAISEALFKEKERAQVTLDSIGDALVCTDTAGRVTYLNPRAERMIGCKREDAYGHPVKDLFWLMEAANGQAVENPMIRAMAENTDVGLTANCVLVRRDHLRVDIEDSASPMHDRQGRVTGAVMVFRDVTAARTLALKLTHQAQHDGLTDLPNRAVLKDRLVQAMALAQRNQTKLALLFLDLDRFKNINDTLGHGIGDRLLKSVGRRLISCVRGSDTVSRQGGDEFVILLSQIGQTRDAAAFASKIIDAIAAPYLIDTHTLNITASIGIAVYPGDGQNPKALMKNADQAMYLAKDRGRHTFHFFVPVTDHLDSERQSLAGNEMKLH